MDCGQFTDLLKLDHIILNLIVTPTLRGFTSRCVSVAVGIRELKAEVLEIGAVYNVHCREVTVSAIDLQFCQNNRA